MNRLIQLQVTSVTLAFSLASISTLAQPIAANTFSSVKAMPSQLGAKRRDLTDVSIGDIKVWMTLQQVTNKLGKPTQTSQILDPCTTPVKVSICTV